MSVLDLFRLDGKTALVSRLAEERVQVDILVNNAGTTHRCAAETVTDEAWARVMATNVDASFRLARELGKGMLARGSGKILFIASMLTFQGGIRVAPYAASKGAVGQLTKALANEWAGRGVNVNALAPGYIATDLTAAIREDAGRDAEILARIPAGRWGTPTDLAGAAVYLCSAAADYVHGAIYAVDGGWLAR